MRAALYGYTYRGCYMWIACIEKTLYANCLMWIDLQGKLSIGLPYVDSLYTEALYEGCFVWITCTEKLSMRTALWG